MLDIADDRAIDCQGVRLYSVFYSRAHTPLSFRWGKEFLCDVKRIISAKLRTICSGFFRKMKGACASCCHKTNGKHYEICFHTNFFYGLLIFHRRFADDISSAKRMTAWLATEPYPLPLRMRFYHHRSGCNMSAIWRHQCLKRSRQGRTIDYFCATTPDGWVN